jgi:DNA polymerase III epsilon subunit-like protein
VGLDIETTGSDPKVHSLIQVGLASGLGEWMSCDVRPYSASYVVEEEAMKVNGFTVERVEAGFPQEQADEMCSEWLAKRFGDERLIPVGWSVGTFDMPFIRKTLPLTAAHFGHRSCDLNAVLFAKTFSTGWKVKGSFDQLKRGTKERVAELLGWEHWHDAGYDALASLAALHVLKEMT